VPYAERIVEIRNCSIPFVELNTYFDAEKERTVFFVGTKESE
jgi:hypothetical protein